ncbi:MAG: phosphoribosylformylglycinamidine synthase subunit PurL [Promethearchaeota archaeon]
MPVISGAEVDLTPEEIEKVKKMLGRLPNEVEAGMIDVMWSEHCSYKSSRPTLALLPKTGPGVIVGPGQDAGVVDIGEGYAVVFKIESHNHPSAIEPYNGAATGIGGIIRDILCMGARPIGLLDPLRFGDPTKPHSKWLLEYVVKGIADYGNCTGIPTIAGEVEFDDSFEQNCLVNVGCVGVVRTDSITPSEARVPGDTLILMGGSTGRDGIHGVTFASRVLTEESEEDRPAVQIGDPFTKKLIIEATLEAIRTGYVRGLKDLGGGGFTCATSEMGGSCNNGVDVSLEKVHLRESDMVPFEIMISESQERMLFAVKPEGVDAVTQVFEKFELPYRIVGKVTETGMVRVYKEGKLIAQVPAKMLEEPPVIERKAERPEYIDKLLEVPRPQMPDDLEQVIYRLLASPNIASMAWIYRQYDHEVGDRTVVKPGQADAAVLRLFETDRAIAVKSDCNSKHCYLDPYNGGAEAVFEACRNIVAVGGKPIAMSNCCNFGNPESPEIFWQFQESVRGMADALKTLGIPCVGGNVSFYNEDSVTGKAVKPAPVVVIVGLIENLDSITTMPFKNPGEDILIVGKTDNELGGSEYYHAIHNLEGGIPPKVDLNNERDTLAAVQDAIKKGYVTAAHDCSKGGLATAIAEMCIESGYGSDINLDMIPSEDLRLDELLFSESSGRFILSVDKDYSAEVLSLMKDYGLPVAIIGSVNSSNEMVLIKGEQKIKCSVPKMQKEWKETIPKLMGVEKWIN